MKNIDIYFMQQALNLANRGRMTVSPNPMVGCIIVKNGAIISEGWHAKAGESHAEIYALKKAGTQAKGSTIYVTLEPCCHQGRTSPCTEAIIKAGVKKTIVATLDPNPKVAGNGIKKLKNSGITVKVGILEKQAQQINKIFFYYQKNKRPFVYAKWTLSLNGKINLNISELKNIKPNQDFINTHKLRNICDAIVVSYQTIIENNPTLNVLINLKNIKNPTRFIIFNKINEINTNWKVINQKFAKTIFVCSNISDEVKIQLNLFDIEYWVLPDGNNQVCLKSLLEKIGNMGLTSLLIEGCKNTLIKFINKKLINEFNTFIKNEIINENNPKESLCYNNIGKLGSDLIINYNFEENNNV